MKLSKLSKSVLIAVCFFYINTYSQTNLENPSAYLSISAFIGQHKISFKNYTKSKGTSFGFNVSLGIFLINNKDYHGGLQFTLLEGASMDKKRRQLSENFNLPNKNYDKHILFNFAQFRAANIGWFNQIDTNNFSFFHLIGFGVFGTTEKDQLFDFSMHNALGILTNKANTTRFLMTITHDAQIGVGNPNYTMSNTAFSFGGFRTF